MRVQLIATWLLLTTAFGIPLFAAPEADRSPSLLLTPKLLRRLKRDHERQTVRWLNFEKRVQTVPDSPERGFELALFYAITGDAERGREAASWALAHPCERRQVALVEDWAGELISSVQRQKLRQRSCPSSMAVRNSVSVLRDTLFAELTDDQGIPSQAETLSKRVLEEMRGPRATDPETVYAACEYIMALRMATRTDLRESEAQFFRLFPKEFLLNLKPDQVEHPPSMAHIAALALVTLDPNLENSQFLQGWGMEDRQMLREGPGVAYELLWADPYLPGIAYQNMDPWIYDPAGRLFARTDWDSRSCWIRLSAASQEYENCSADALRQPAVFGSLLLMPATSPCFNLPPRANRETVILWRLMPGQPLTYESGGEQMRSHADRAGLWTSPIDTTGKVCISARGKQ